MGQKLSRSGYVGCFGCASPPEQACPDRTAGRGDPVPHCSLRHAGIRRRNVALAASPGVVSANPASRHHGRRGVSARKRQAAVVSDRRGEHGHVLTRASRLARRTPGHPAGLRPDLCSSLRRHARGLATRAVRVRLVPPRHDDAGLVGAGFRRATAGGALRARECAPSPVPPWASARWPGSAALLLKGSGARSRRTRSPWSRPC